MKINLIMCISKILTDLCAIKQKNKNKKYFCKCCLKCFSNEKVLKKHKENSLMINGKQNVKLKSDSNNYFKQLPVAFKIYADFECIFKKFGCDSIKNNSSYTEKYHIFLVVLLTKLFVLIINSVKKLFFTEEKMLFTNLLKQFLVSIVIVGGDKNTF